MPKGVVVKRQITKFERFAKELVDNPQAIPSELASRIYDCKNNRVASSIAAENLKKLNIKGSEIANRLGMDLEFLLGVVKKKTTAKDPTFCGKKKMGSFDNHEVQLAATTLGLRVHGALNDKSNGNGHVINVYGDLTVQQINEMPESELDELIQTTLTRKNVA